MDFIRNAVQRVDAAIDKLQDKIGDALLNSLEPRVHGAIDSNVDAFRDATLTELPRQSEDELKRRSAESSVAWVFDKVGCPQ